MAAAGSQGTIKGSESAYQLDDHHRFVKGKPLLVCGNSGAMVGENGVSWLSKHFEVRPATRSSAQRGCGFLAIRIRSEICTAVYCTARWAILTRWCDSCRRQVAAIRTG